MGLWSRGDRFTRRIARILAQASFCRTASSTVGASAGLPLPTLLRSVGSTRRRIPVIRRAIERELERAEAAGEPAVILDIPLLFETGWQEHVDESWLVDVPEPLQLARLQSRNGYSREEAKRRIAAQMPLAKKRQLADILIDNSGTEQDLAEKLRRLWQSQPGQAAADDGVGREAETAGSRKGRDSR